MGRGAPYYSGEGRPGVDPVVLVKLFLVAALRGIDSMRELLRVAEVDLSIRRFLGYGWTEALPHHATLSYAQCVRFARSSVFEQLCDTPETEDHDLVAAPIPVLAGVS